MERVVILHYHLFKNAGTSVDRILKYNFPGRWITAEFERKPTREGNSDLVTQWIRDNPDAIAFSTHTAWGPIPKIPGVRLISVVFLRDPIERISSAYWFERQQQANTLGARLAKENDFEGYVRARLAIPNDRQCRNFQTERLASMIPGPEAEIERAYKALEEITFIGIVSDFNHHIQRMKRMLVSYFPNFEVFPTHENKTNKRKSDTFVSNVNDDLIKNNLDDLELIRYARNLIEGEKT